MKFLFIVTYIALSSLSYGSAYLEEQDQPSFFKRTYTSFKSHTIEGTTYVVDKISDSPLGQIPNYAQKAFDQLNRNPMTKIATGIGLITMAQIGLYTEDKQSSLEYTLTLGAGAEWIFNGIGDILQPAISFTYKTLSQKFSSQTSKRPRKNKYKISSSIPSQEKLQEEAENFTNKFTAYVAYSINMATSTHTFFRYLDQLTYLYHAGINPLSLSFPEGIASCTGGSFLCMPLTTSLALLVCSGGTLYNLNEIINLYKTGKVHEKDVSLFGVFNGLALSGFISNKFIPYAKKHAVCETYVEIINNIQRPYIKCALPSYLLALIKGGGSYANWLAVKNAVKILKNGGQYTAEYLHDYMNKELLEEIYEETAIQKASQWLSPQTPVTINYGDNAATGDSSNMQAQTYPPLPAPAPEYVPHIRKQKVKTRKVGDISKKKARNFPNQQLANISGESISSNKYDLRTMELFKDICKSFKSSCIDVKKELFPLITEICKITALDFSLGEYNVSLGRYTFELPHGNKGELKGYRKRKVQKALIHALFNEISQEEVSIYFHEIEKLDKEYSLPGFIKMALFSRS